MKYSLCKHRISIGSGLALASVVNCFVRYDGGGDRFFTILITQLWFAQAVYNYCNGGTILIAPWGLDADPEWRLVLASFALLLYVAVFFLDFKVDG